MTLITKWSELLYRTVTGSRRILILFAPIGAIFFGLLALLFVVASLQVDRWIDMTARLPGRLTTLLSLPLFPIAFFMIGWSVHHFFKILKNTQVFPFPTIP